MDGLSDVGLGRFASSEVEGAHGLPAGGDWEDEGNRWTLGLLLGGDEATHSVADVVGV